MSLFNPNAARWDIPASEYKVVMGVPNDNCPPELQHTLDLEADNESEIINWAAFFRSYLGRGLLCFRYKEGEYSFPPEYLQGRELASLPSVILEDLNQMDMGKCYGFALINEDLNLLHAIKCPFPETIDPVYYEGVEFTDAYTKEEDDREIEASTDVQFIASHKAFLDHDYAKALGLVNQVIDRNPYYSRAYSSRGILYEVFQDYRYALASYFDALEVNPHNWRALYRAGLLFNGIGAWPIAVRYMISAVVVNHHCIPGYEWLVWHYEQQKDYSNAFEVIHDGLKKNPDDKNLAICLEKLESKYGNKVPSEKAK